jgi:hypothetical protein
MVADTASAAPSMVAQSNNAPVVTVAKSDLPRSIDAVEIVANPEVAMEFATGGKNKSVDDLVDDFFGGKSSRITKIGKGWRLEKNSDGRLRWRWQVKDSAGNTVTYIKTDGSLGYARGSSYVGITQVASAKGEDRARVKGKHKRRRRRKTGS